MKIVSEKISFRGSLTLESGQVLAGFELMIETYGELNLDKTNAAIQGLVESGKAYLYPYSDAQDEVQYTQYNDTDSDTNYIYVE